MNDYPDVVRIADEAAVMTVWEFLSKPEPARLEYAMECYLESLIHSGMTLDRAKIEAKEQTAAAIDAAAGSIRGIKRKPSVMITSSHDGSHQS